MKWRDYLYHSQDIAEDLGCSVATVEKWKSNNSVPRTRFETLKPVLEKLGYKLTEIEMGELNE